MQKHVFEQQPSAYLQLEKYKRPEISEEILAGIKQKARREWPKDFEMQLHVIEEQCKAYLRIRGH
jgi:hypothetical protein